MKLLKRLGQISAGTLVLLTLQLVLHAPHAHASCGREGSTGSSSPADLIVHAKDNAGNPIDGISFTLYEVNGNKSIWHWDAGGNNDNSVDNLGLNSHNTCAGAGTEVLAYSSDGGNSWNMACKEYPNGYGNGSTGNPANFSFRNISNPAGRTGSWSIPTFQVTNGITNPIDLIWTDSQPPPPPPPPGPPAPSVSNCPNGMNGVSEVRISWNSGDNPGGTTGYTVDLDDDTWGGAWWNKDSGGATNLVAPGGFRWYDPNNPGSSGPGITFDVVGKHYQVRVYYQGAGVHSKTLDFQAPNCSNGPPPPPPPSIPNPTVVQNCSGNTIIGTVSWTIINGKSENGHNIDVSTDSSFGNNTGDFYKSFAAGISQGDTPAGMSPWPGSSPGSFSYVAGQDYLIRVHYNKTLENTANITFTPDGRCNPPPPPPSIPDPTVTQNCSGNTIIGTVSWTIINGKSDTGHNIDVSTDSSFGNNTGDFYKQFNAGISQGDTPAGMSPWPGSSPGSFSYVAGQSYLIQILYRSTNEHSGTITFTPDGRCGGSPPPPPGTLTINPKCVGGVPVVDVAWGAPPAGTSFNAYGVGLQRATPPPFEGWKKDRIPTTTQNLTAPTDGFATLVGPPNMTSGAQYIVSVSYENVSGGSVAETAYLNQSFTAPNCGGPVTPPAPTLTPTCTNNAPSVKIDWNGVNGLTPTSFTVDVDNDNFAGGWWYKDVSSAGGGPYGTTAPSGFSAYNITGNPPLTLSAGQPYQVRINYRAASGGTDVYSSPNTFTARSDCVPPPPADPAPTGTLLSATCTRLTGWTTDDSKSSQALKVDVYVDAARGAAGTRSLGLFSANQPNPPGTPGGTAANHGFSIDVSSYQDYQAHPFYVYAQGIDSNGTANGVNPLLGNAPLSSGPCATYACNLQTVPAEPEAGVSFDAKLSFTYGASGTAGSQGATISRNAPQNQKMHIHLNLPTAYDNPDQPYGDITPGNTAIIAIPGLSGPVGLYDTSLSLTLAGINVVCSSVIGPGIIPLPPIIIAKKPYLRVYGGDVIAGSGFGSSCTANTIAAILGYNRGGSPDYGGAATQFAAQAMTAINQFASASLRTTAPVSPTGLSFASGPPYGGSFGYAPCASDYYARGVLSGAPINSGTPIAYTVPTNTVAVAEKRVLYVNGNAVINNHILYASPGAWTSLDQIPTFYLVVKGNIYIQKNVDQLDGVYIAQPRDDNADGLPDPGTGIIYSCANGTSLYAPTTLDSNCAAPLTVNGAFIAQTVKFLRTPGTLSKSGDLSGGNGTLEPNTSGNIAELFNYSPELWLNPAFSQPGFSSYQAIKNLPPVL